jgi:hypothetical protein
MSNSKKKILEHLSQEVYCHLGVSPVHGIGVFAIRAIPKGVNPMKSLLKFEELRFSPEEIKALPRSVRKEIAIFCYYDDDEVRIPSIGLNSMNMAVYLNHSKNPNVQYKKNGQLISLQAIKRGEELMMDYDINFGATHIFE